MLPKNLIAILLIISCAILTLQQDSCIVPDGNGQSTCIRAHRCEFITNLIKQYNGRPPQNVQQTIKSYYCPTPGLVCCPDNAVPLSSTTHATARSQTISMIPPPNITTNDGLPSKPTDLNSIKNHPRIALLNSKTCGQDTSYRIVGGINAEVKEFPWAVLLGYDEDFKIEWNCGGTLIHAQFVLTAAHCIPRISKKLSIVRLGEHTVSTELDCKKNDKNIYDYSNCADPVQDIKIERATQHPFYIKGLKKNDIAILKLAQPADVTKNNVRTICLPLTPESDFDKVKAQKFIISGWGLLANGQKSDILQKAYIPFVENDACVQTFAPHKNINIYRTYLCAGSKNKTDTCKGDSGGGISTFANIHQTPKTTLYGIVSGGVECLNKNLIFPGIYTNIRYYLDWILDNMY